jgi:hypothetical protein
MPTFRAPHLWICPFLAGGHRSTDRSKCRSAGRVPLRRVACHPRPLRLGFREGGEIISLSWGGRSCLTYLPRLRIRVAGRSGESAYRTECATLKDEAVAVRVAALGERQHARAEILQANASFFPFL